MRLTVATLVALAPLTYGGYVDTRVIQGSDDAEQTVSSGNMNLTSTDMELVFDGSTRQIVGLRFQDITIPQGATIVSAVLELVTDETDTGSTSVLIRGQNADNAATFTTTNSNISSRTTTSASVAWNNITAWNSVNEVHQSPDITSIVQEIINRPGWSSNNALVFLIEAAAAGCTTSACQRTAESFNGESNSAPALRIEYEGVQTAPSAAICYAVADSNDELKQIPLTGGSAGVATTLGDTGASSIEAVAYQVEHGALYGSDSNQLGRLNRSSGQFFPLASTYGTGTATVGGSATNVAFTDVDGLSFDPTTLVLYGSNVSAGNDELFVILTTTGAFLDDAFGTGEDFVELTGTGSNNIGTQVDDIAFDPADSGQLYATNANELYTVDKTDGTTTLVADLRVGSTTGTDITDMEGLSFDDSGQLYGTTGDSGPASTQNRLWTINKSTGVATQVGTGTLGSGADYEGSECTFTANLTYTSVTSLNVTTDDGASTSGGLIVEWQTAGEVGTLGFYLERWDEATRRYRRLNERPLPALLSSPQGGIYRFSDSKSVTAALYAYRLIELESSGRMTAHGPFVGEVEAARKSESSLAYSAPDTPGGFSRQAHPVTTFEAVTTGYRAEPIQGSVAAPQKALAAGISNGARLGRIAVRDSGLIHLASEDIAAALGRTVDWVRRRLARDGLRLTHRGKAVALLTAADASGVSFYGEAIDSVYSDENIYWIRPGRGLTMREQQGPLVTPTSTPGTFFDTFVFEEDHSPVVSVQTDPEQGLWFWQLIVAGSPSLSSTDLTVDTPSIDTSEPARLVLTCLGVSPHAAGPDYRARIRLNGVDVGEVTWDGNLSQRLELGVDPGLLVDGSNTVTVTGLLEPDATTSIFFIDRLEIGAQRRYQAVDGNLLLRGDHHDVVTVEGFNSPDLAVFDLSRPRRPKLLHNIHIESDDAGHQVSFAPSTPDTPYLAVDLSMVDTLPVMPRQWPAFDPAGADYLVVAPAALVATATRLADHRAAQGLTATVAALEDVELAFNHGVAHPGALRDFLRWARQNWQLPPRYVVLAGDGSWDYTNVLGLNENLLPPLLVSTPHGLVGSDLALVDLGLASADLPSVSIGRLPVRSATELDQVIDKLIAYDSAGGTWRRHVLLLADNPDSAGDFSSDSDTIAEILAPAASTEQIHLDDHPLSTAREQLLTRLDEGAVMVNYIGHGGVDRMADEGLLTVADINALSNGDRLPVVTALSCLSGRFDLPGFASLGEALVRADDRGAIALWGATLLSNNPDAATLDRALYQAIFASELTSVGASTLGEAITEALRTLVATGSADHTMPYVYQLLGDPATLVP